jgi:hypothetical protein
VYLTAFRFGSWLAAPRFMPGVELPVRKLIKASKGVNIHREQSSEPYISVRDGIDFLVKQELLPITNYLPDIELIPVVPVASGKNQRLELASIISSRYGSLSVASVLVHLYTQSKIVRNTPLKFASLSVT